VAKKPAGVSQRNITDETTAPVCLRPPLASQDECGHRQLLDLSLKRPPRVCGSELSRGRRLMQPLKKGYRRHRPVFRHARGHRQLAKHHLPEHCAGVSRATIRVASRLRDRVRTADNPQALDFQVLDGHASDERSGTSAKSSWLKMIKVARCTRAWAAIIRSSSFRRE